MFYNDTYMVINVPTVLSGKICLNTYIHPIEVDSGPYDQYCKGMSLTHVANMYCIYHFLSMKWQNIS